MKRITILIAIISLVLVGCTASDQAETIVDCPCTITKIEYEGNVNKFRVRAAEAISSNRNGQYFSFYTTHRYNLGDTIN